MFDVEANDVNSRENRDSLWMGVPLTEEVLACDSQGKLVMAGLTAVTRH